MYREYPSLDAWASDVRSGRITLANGCRLSLDQLARLRLAPGPMALDARHGAPGSRMALDAAAAEQALTRTAQAHQQQRDLTAQSHASPTSRIAATVATQLQRSGAWSRLERDRAQHVQANATLDPMHALAARITKQHQLPTVTGANEDPDDIGSRFTRRIKDQFRSSNVPLASDPTQPQRETVTQQLQALREAVDRLVVLVEALAAGDVTMNASVRSHLQHVAQKHEAQQRLGVA